MGLNGLRGGLLVYLGVDENDEFGLGSCSGARASGLCDMSGQLFCVWAGFWCLWGIGSVCGVSIVPVTSVSRLRFESFGLLGHFFKPRLSVRRASKTLRRTFGLQMSVRDHSLQD